mmetsp:Transcript_28027/g.52547  ORF Transcript_28027/g.52547 Transcript_28027/m.52547 type:complete len:87 (+) Transcript_28027:402-662(+)
MDGAFSFAEAPEEYLDFLREKRRQMAGLIVSSIGSGVAGALAVALARGDPLEVIFPAATTMAGLFVITVLGLGAYGVTQGGDRRDL